MLKLKMELDGKIEHFKALQGARRALMQDLRRVQEERARTKAEHELLRDPEIISANIEEIDDRLEETRKEIERLKIALFNVSNQNGLDRELLNNSDV